jgi:1-aminocyclopropane-1-carboxylate deaminase
VLRGATFLDQDVARLQPVPIANWSISHDFHCGGYARRTPELTAFIADFERRHGIGLDWVYAGKMMRGIFTLAEQKSFRPGTTAVALITGPPG